MVDLEKDSVLRMKRARRLTQGIVPAFDMCRLPSFLADRCMLLLWYHRLVRGPEIGEAVA